MYALAPTEVGGEQRKAFRCEAKRIEVERRPVAQAVEQGAMAQGVDQPPGGRPVEGRQGVGHVPDRFDVDPAEAQHHQNGVIAIQMIEGMYEICDLGRNRLEIVQSSCLQGT